MARGWGDVELGGNPLSPLPAPAGLETRRLELGEQSVLVMSFPLCRSRARAGLTSAERDVVRQVLGGASNAQVATARGSSPRTVANQLAAIFRKLEVGSRLELAQQLAAADLEEGG